MLLMLSATVTGEILGYYENAMAVMPVLITFIPMLMGTGGNCGSQSSTLVIRGLAVGEIEFKDIFRVIFKEIRIALIVGLLLSVVNGIRIYIMYDQNIMLALALGITMIAVVHYGEVHRMYPAAPRKEAGAGSGDHGGASDHDDPGYVYDPCVFQYCDRILPYIIGRNETKKDCYFCDKHRKKVCEI